MSSPDDFKLIVASLEKCRLKENKIPLARLRKAASMVVNQLDVIDIVRLSLNFPEITDFLLRIFPEGYEI